MHALNCVMRRPVVRKLFQIRTGSGNKQISAMVDSKVIRCIARKMLPRWKKILIYK